jgi:hypothetical protein
MSLLLYVITKVSWNTRPNKGETFFMDSDTSIYTLSSDSCLAVKIGKVRKME